MSTCSTCGATLDAAQTSAGQCDRCRRKADAQTSLDTSTLELPSQPTPTADLTTPAAQRQRLANQSTLDAPATSSSPSNITLGQAPDATLDQPSVATTLLQTLETDELARARPEVTLRGRSTAAHDETASSTLVIRSRDFRPAEQAPERRTTADYYLQDLLGEGGMGVVYRARQASIDREVAVKMLKPYSHHDPSQRRKFLSEAAVTGELDHPNIVPIYDLGENAEGALFYSMKMVQGTPWSKVIHEKTLPENLEIYLKVADAIAFAHARGVVHRDLKPENIMLGEFGEVLVLDWGLAVATEDHRPTTNVSAAYNIAGTPAYMSPELARGPLESIGKHSDVYLLGAILFEIVTGRPPHSGMNAVTCLHAAARNEIIATDASGELFEIALTAMATLPQNRYPGVQALQKAIRGYQSHSESIALCDRAQHELRLASEAGDYQGFARAIFGFTEAYSIWDGNDTAKAGVSRAKLLYAQSALGNHDYDLGLSLLQADDPAHVPVREQLLAAKSERDARQQRLQTARRVVFGLAAATFIAVSVGIVLVTRLKLEADRQAAIARAAEVEAHQEKDRAEQNEQRAIAAQLEASKNAKSAAEQRGLALEALGGLVTKVQNQLRETPATQQLKQDLLLTGLEGLRKVAKSAQNSQAADGMMAEAHQRMGDMFQSLAQHTDARQEYEKSHSVRLALAQRSPDQNDAQRQLAFSFGKLGDISFLEGDTELARQHYSEARKLREALAANDPTSDQAQVDLATSYVMLGKVSEPAIALDYYTQALELRQKLAASAAEGSRPIRERDIWIIYNRLAELSLRLKDTAEAQRYFDRALAQAKKLVMLVPKSVRAKSELALSHVNVGKTRSQLGQLDEARESFGQALALLRPLAADDPRNLDVQANFALVLARHGDYEEAAQKAEDLRQLAPQNYLNLYNVACCYSLCVASINRIATNEIGDSEVVSLQKQYGDRAIAVLREAAKRGLKGTADVMADPDLDAIRVHPEYKQLLAQLK